MIKYEATLAGGPPSGGTIGPEQFSNYKKFFLLSNRKGPVDVGGAWRCDLCAISCPPTELLGGDIFPQDGAPQLKVLEAENNFPSLVKTHTIPQ